MLTTAVGGRSGNSNANESEKSESELHFDGCVWFWCSFSVEERVKIVGGDEGVQLVWMK